MLGAGGAGHSSRRDESYVADGEFIKEITVFLKITALKNEEKLRLNEEIPLMC